MPRLRVQSTQKGRNSPLQPHFQKRSGLMSRARLPPPRRTQGPNCPGEARVLSRQLMAESVLRQYRSLDLRVEAHPVQMNRGHPHSAIYGSQSLLRPCRELLRPSPTCRAHVEAELHRVLNMGGLTERTPCRLPAYNGTCHKRRQGKIAPSRTCRPSTHCQPFQCPNQLCPCSPSLSRQAMMRTATTTA